MASEPDWLTADQLIELNELIVGETSEPFVLIKPGELESAAARPQQLWHYEGEEDVAALAVRLLVGVASNHPFAQGNKRTGFEAALIFLDANGYELALDDHAEVADLIIAVIEGNAGENDLVDLFRDNLAEIDFDAYDY